MTFRAPVSAVLAATLLCLATSTAGAQTRREARGWLCKPEQATGFVYDARQRRWVTRTFTLEDSFVIQRPSEADLQRLSPPPVWVVTTSFGGLRVVDAWCPTEPNEKGYMRCPGYSMIDVNVREGRFLKKFDGQYMTRSDMVQLSDSPQADNVATTIGTCSPL